METPAVEFAWTGDTALAYQVIGEGSIDLFYLPGWVSNLDVQWQSPHVAKFLLGLAEGTRLIVADRRGWGCSERFAPPHVPALETLSDDIGVVLDHAGSRRAVVMATHDSGMIAQLFAAAHPERVLALVLYQSLVSFSATAEMPWLPDSQWWAGVMAGTMREWGRRYWGASSLRAGGPSEEEWFYRFQRACCTPGALVAETRRFLASDTSDVLAAIRVPTLVLSGLGDYEPFLPETAQYIADQIPTSHLVELNGQGDEMWYRPAETIVGEVELFLSQITDERTVFDRILATVVFTDIVDSTAQAVALGDRRWRGVRERHDEIVREQLGRFRGREVKTMGDGFLATFDGPARAVRCAQAIVTGVRDLGIGVRAGLHTGEIELDGDDVAGIAVAIGARIGAIADPSEVLVSQTVKDLTAGSGVVYSDRGEHELKGVPDRWRLYQAVS